MKHKWLLFDEFDKFSYIHMAMGDVDPVYFMIRYSDLSVEEKKKLIFTNLMLYKLPQSFKVVEIEDLDEYYDAIKRSFEELEVAQDRKDVAMRETREASRMFGTQIPKMRIHSPIEWVDLAIEETLEHKCWGKSVKGGQLIPTFGEYFGFKLADMIEVVFDYDKSHGYDVPWSEEFRKTIPRGTLTGYEMTMTGKKSRFDRKAPAIKKCELIQEFFERKLEIFNEHPSPHKPTRVIGVQEVETLLCDFRKVSKGTLKFGDKVKKCYDAIEANKGQYYAEACRGAVDIMMKRREYLMNEVGFDNITPEHAKEDVFEWYEANKDKSWKPKADAMEEWF